MCCLIRDLAIISRSGRLIDELNYQTWFMRRRVVDRGILLELRSEPKLNGNVKNVEVRNLN